MALYFENAVKGSPAGLELVSFTTYVCLLPPRHLFKTVLKLGWR